MAKYGGFKYSAAKYGYTDNGTRLAWGLIVDWDDTGSFISGYNEAYSYNENEHKLFELNTKAGRQYFMNQSGDNFQPVDPSQMQAQLFDRGGRYDPFNMDGPLYQKILPGRKFKLIVKDEVNQVTYPIMIGRIEDIRPNYGSVSTVTITGRNGIQDLQNVSINTTQVYTTEQYDEAIKIALIQAEWDGGINFDTASTETMPYWWLSGKTAYNEIMDLVHASRGLFFVSNEGKATYLSSVNSPDPVTSFIDNDALLSYGIRVPTPWEAIKNYVRVYAKARKQQSITLWTLASTPLIDAGGSITIFAEYNSSTGENVPALSVTTPVANTDYTANSNESGTGTNLTANISIALTTFATSAKLVISNTGGTAAYLTLMKLRGNAIVSDDYTFTESIDSASINLYRTKLLEIKTDWMQNINEATDYADTMITILSNPKQFPRFVVRNKPSKQFKPDIFDIVTVDFTSKKLTGDFRVGYIEHNWVISNGDIVDTTFYLEPNIAGNISGTWIFPAVFGKSTIF